VLIGPPGAGKSTVAAELARLWGVSSRDTDDDIATTAGRDIPSIFVNDGEDEFRRLERDAVQAALREHDGVLALGGGAILNVETQAELAELAEAGGSVVFLDVGIAAAAPRVGFSGARPLLATNPRQEWLRLMEQRRGVYERLATFTVSTDGAEPADIARQSAAELS
jgi:shikimate kinase